MVHKQAPADLAFSKARFASERRDENLAHLHMHHGTPMLRELSGVDMELQRNKMASLAVAASCIDGLIIKPGETFSFWRLVGKPTARRGFKMGLVLRNGTIQQDVGGGLQIPSVITRNMSRVANRIVKGLLGGHAIQVRPVQKNKMDGDKIRLCRRDGVGQDDK
ncbi:MAG: VanW family protein [Hyellaceae cyanobacterium CSU_1_1]|nr:VanW family protein [Hyellaceae cyanobacterium CSU_1_1]